MNFTPELLNAALERYKFTEKDKEYVLKQSADIKNFDPEKTLKHLIENSEGRLDIYEPAEELLQNLRALVAFPNNSEFLGICGNRVNFEDVHWMFNDEKNNQFVLKSEVPLFLFKNLKSSHCEVSVHLLKAYVHKLYRILKNTLEFIPGTTVIKMYEEACQAVENWKSKFANQYTVNDYNFIEYTPEEVYSTISKFYEAESDQEFLIELQEQLKITAQNLPVNLNLNAYEGVLLNCHYIEQFMKYAREHYMHIFVPKLKIDKSFPHFRVIRVFEHKTKKYVLVKDLKFALMNYENVKIKVETEEERKNGIIRAMKYQKFVNILKQAGLTENDMNIIPLKIQKTKHDVNVPIPTSYGTHCKLALDAFSEVFRIFSIDLNWFNTVSEKNYYKLGHWFNAHSDVFSDTRKEVYFIEVWKIEELKNRAYEEMKKYTRKPKYVVPNTVRFMTKDRLHEEIDKFGSHFQKDSDWWKDTYLDKESDKDMSKWDILVMYDDICLFEFTLEARKIANFVMNHTKRRGAHLDFSHLSGQRTLFGIAVDDQKLDQVSKFYYNLDAHRIGFLKEYVYSMSTLSGDCYYENDTCLKLALDKTIEDESVKSKIISLVYEAEMKKFENHKRSVFYLTEEELSTFCSWARRIFEEIMKENLDDFDWEIDQYPKKLQDTLKNNENSEELLEIGLKAQRIFEECSEQIRNFKDYCRDDKKRTIVMRIMSDLRNDDLNDWHMFSEEVLEAIEVVLENEGRLETMKDKIDKWKNSWKNEGTFTTVTVQLFKTILDVVGIEQSKFTFMPDVQFFKNYIDLPMKMGYNAMKLLSPDGREVYHQTQAQLLMLQYGVCDVVWNSENKKAKDKHKKKVLEEMSKIGKGYTLAETIEQSVEMLKYSDVAQKTALSFFHGKSYDSHLNDEEVRIISKFVPTCKIEKKGFESFIGKALVMSMALEKFIKRGEDKELNKNIWKALTVSFGFTFMKSLKDFEQWYSLGWNEFAKSDFDMMKNIATARFKNESGRSSYDDRELVEQHYLFDESDPLGTLAKEKKGNQRDRKMESKLEMRDDKEDLMKILKMIPKVTDSIFDELSDTIDKLTTKLLIDHIYKEYDEEEADRLSKVLDSKEGKEAKKANICEFLDVANIGRIMKCKGKEETVKKMKTKQEKEREEGPKVVVKYVTETKTVENCVNCRNIEKETTGFRKKIESFEKEIEEYQRIIRQKDEDLTMLKSQIGQNKLKFREEIQKHKENVENREMKIEQLNQEIKEYREDSKMEREKLYSDVRNNSRIADESLRKMKTELENSKFLETAKNKKIDELTVENRQLKTSLEISEENLEVSEKAREEAENRVKLLEKRNEEMAFSFEDAKFEEDLYIDPEMIVGDFEEILQFDVYGILGKITRISDKYGMSNSEIVRFQRRYDMYIRIVENELCWETAEVPDFPIPFSAEFMQNYERCLKEDVMGSFRETKWYNCTHIPPVNNYFDPNQGFYM